MNTNKMIVLLMWLGGWLIIGLHYSLFKQMPISEMLTTFVEATLFLGTLFVIGEVRSYVKKRANQK